MHSYLLNNDTIHYYNELVIVVLIIFFYYIQDIFYLGPHRDDIGGINFLLWQIFNSDLSLQFLMTVKYKYIFKTIKRSFFSITIRIKVVN